MTVASTYTPPQYAGDGTTKGFAFPYNFFATSDLVVTLFDVGAGSDVTPAPVLGGGGTYDYSVSGTQDADTGEYLSGATVTFNTAPPSGYTVTVQRSVSATQNVSLNNNAPFPAKTVEGSVDRLTMLVQETRAGLARTLSAPASDSAASLTVPPAASRANLLLGFDSTGLPVAKPATLAAVSSALNPVLGAATTFEGAAALGAVPTVATVAALRAVAVTDVPAAVFVEGYASAADGGEGLFVLDSADTASADNGGTIIVDGGGHRWRRVIDGQPLSLLWFGGVGSGSTDNAAAFNAMMAVAVARPYGAAVEIPPGRYTIASALTVDFPASGGFDLVVYADGATLYWPNANGGIAFNLYNNAQTVRWTGGRITTGQAASGTGMTLTYAPNTAGSESASVLRDIKFMGENMSEAVSFSDHWQYNLIIDGVSDVTVIGCDFCGGTGASVKGPGSGSFGYSIVVNFTDCLFLANDLALLLGPYLQSLGVSGCNFINFSTSGITAQNAAGTTSDIRIRGNDIAGGSGVSIALVDADANYIEISGNSIIGAANANAVWVQNYNVLSITGNSISGGTGSVGVLLRGSNQKQGTVISGNVIEECASAGVLLDAAGTDSNGAYAAASRCLVTGNSFHNCVLTDNGTNNTVPTGANQVYTA